MFTGPFTPSNAVLDELSAKHPQLRSAMLWMVVKLREPIETLETLAAKALMEASMRDPGVRLRIKRIVRSNTPKAFSPLFFGHCRALRELILGYIGLDGTTIVVVFKDVIYVMVHRRRDGCLERRYPEGRFPRMLMEVFEMLLNCKRTLVTICLSEDFWIAGPLVDRLKAMALAAGLQGVRYSPAIDTRHFLASLMMGTRFISTTFCRLQIRQR